MRKLIPLLFLLVGATLFAADTPAPKAASTGGKSAHETTSAKIDGNRVILVYGRPMTKDPKTGEMRQIWGKLVPYGKIWRTGSDEATLLITQQPITLGGVALAAGAYSLYSFPAEDGSLKLVINKSIGQWGVDPYPEATELARVDMTKSTLPASVDQFTMEVAKNPDGGGLIKMRWETTEYSVPFTVKK